MNRIFWLGALVVMLLGACITPDYGYDDDGPPPEVITTEEPVYYGGVSLYWYGGGWMYRDDHGRWAHYNHEVPASVPHANVHASNVAPRRYYGQGGYRGTAAPRGGGRGGGGGGHRR